MAIKEGEKLSLEYPEEVLHSLDLCWNCGVCLSFCHRKERSFELKGKLERNEKGEECQDCVICLEICPRVHPDPTPYEERFLGQRAQEPELGFFLGAFSVKAAEKRGKVQYGGVVTALIRFALETGWADAAFLLKRSADWKAMSYLAASPEEVESSAGSKYSCYPAAHSLTPATERFNNIIYVGLPCQIGAMRRMMTREKYDHASSKIKLMIGLVCSACFEHEALKSFVETDLGIPMNRVEKFDITKGKLKVIADGKEELRPVKELQHIYWPSCFACIDSTSLLADMTVGAIGSLPGESTALVRTPLAQELFSKASAASLFDVAVPIRDIKRLKRFAEIKREKVATVEHKTMMAITKKGVRRNLSTIDIIPSVFALELLEQIGATRDEAK